MELYGTFLTSPVEEVEWKSKWRYDYRSVSQSVSPSWYHAPCGALDQSLLIPLIFNALCHRVTPSLARGRVCDLSEGVECQTDSQSQSHVTADGQSASPSWCRAPSGTHDQKELSVKIFVPFIPGERPPPPPTAVFTEQKARWVTVVWPLWWWHKSLLLAGT
jgi:hypothetical protein